MTNAEIRFIEEGINGDVSIIGFPMGSTGHEEKNCLEIRCVHPDEEECYIFSEKNSVEVEFDHKTIKMFKEYKGYTTSSDPVRFEDCHLPPYVLKALAMLGWGYR